MLTQEVQKELALGMHQVYEKWCKGLAGSESHCLCSTGEEMMAPLTSWFLSQFLSVCPR